MSTPGGSVEINNTPDQPAPQAIDVVVDVMVSTGSDVTELVVTRQSLAIVDGQLQLTGPKRVGRSIVARKMKIS